MVTRDTAWPPGTPCWVDLGVADIPKAKAFYSGLFGWEIQDDRRRPAATDVRDRRPARWPASAPRSGPPDSRTFWTTYLASTDADETAAKIKAAGGQVMMDPFDVMDVGRMFIAADPGGAHVRRLAGAHAHWRPGWPTSRARSSGART